MYALPIAFVMYALLVGTDPASAVVNGFLVWLALFVTWALLTKALIPAGKEVLPPMWRGGRRLVKRWQTKEIDADGDPIKVVTGA